MQAYFKRDKVLSLDILKSFKICEMYKGRVYFHCDFQVVCLTKDPTIQIPSNSSGMNHLLVVFVLAILLSIKRHFVEI